jgi:DNA polymerase-3 subunit alpha
MGLFALVGVKINSEIKLEPATPASNFEKLGWEKELLGLYVSSHPLNDFKKLFETKTTAISKIDASFVNKKIILGGLVSSVKKIITKNGKPMLFIKLEDLTGKAEVVVFPNLLERNPVALQENKIVFFAGRVDDRNGFDRHKGYPTEQHAKKIREFGACPIHRKSFQVPCSE